MTKTVIIFDFDGVIIDSFGFHLQNIRSLYAPNMTADEYRAAHKGNVYNSNESQDINWKEYFKSVRPRMQEKAVYRGMDDVLTRDVIGSQTAIVSSASRKNIIGHLERHNLLPVFDLIYGMEESPSKVEKFETVRKLFDVTKEEILFITDTVGDIREANAYGIDTVAVTWGFHERSDLERYPTAMVVDTPKELKEYILTQK